MYIFKKMFDLKLLYPHSQFGDRAASHVFEDKNEFVRYGALGARPASTDYDASPQKDQKSARDSQNEVTAVSVEDGPSSQGNTQGHTETPEAVYSQVVPRRDRERQADMSYGNEAFVLEEVVLVSNESLPSSPSKGSSNSG